MKRAESVVVDRFGSRHHKTMKEFQMATGDSIASRKQTKAGGHSAAKSNTKPATIYQRINLLGWSIEKALTTPTRQHK